ncbi:MAG: tyrosine-type recombinase/integrase, partial [Terriglobia bacterium]
MARKRKQDRDGVYWRKDCRKYWISYLDAKGERQREPGSINWDEARDMLAQVLARVKEEQDLRPGELLPCRENFADVADRLLAHQKPRLTPKAYEREAGIVAHLNAFFTGKLSDVAPAQVSDYVTMRLGKVSKGSVRKELVTLKHLFRLACGEWKLLPRFQNPTLDVTAPKVLDERTQHLTPDQFRRLLGASPENMKPIFALLTATGMRRSELLNCRWKYVDQTRILLPTSKNDEPKEIHLNAFAQSVLASTAQGGPEDRVFPDVTPEAVSMAFHRVCEQLRFSDIRLHDLRHTFGTWLRQQGVELDMIASQLGHRDLRMTKRYARIASAQVRQAVAGLDSLLEGAE